MQPMTISQLARAAGVGIETVRYYQRRGLLEVPTTGPIGTPGRGIRRYGDDALRRLRFIRSAQAAGFTLEGIVELLQLDASDDRARVRALATERIAALDARLAELQAARDALAGLARRCSASDAGPCPILEAFDRPVDAPGAARR
ncbi:MULTISPECIES: MerR family transcriptional regulator [Luteimonas]|uniref:MerR family transcriptional regulator n=1 Tax=Luteimonas TaxID=83614 RepID=UPI000C7A91E7|nr:MULTISPECIES: MerR family transcriptional regulator [Luteimonas]